MTKYKMHFRDTFTAERAKKTIKGQYKKMAIQRKGKTLLFKNIRSFETALGYLEDMKIKPISYEKDGRVTKRREAGLFDDIGFGGSIFGI